MIFLYKTQQISVKDIIITNLFTFFLVQLKININKKKILRTFKVTRVKF